ncbi:MAG: hypothetical protein IH987_03925 [Planctomycetes bacterium]|nr:hypothetical protein [Planctomycetota bacterium]
MFAFRELDEAFRLTEWETTVPSDPRHEKNRQHTFLAMWPPSVYGRPAGDENVNDAEPWGIDTAVRRADCGRAKEKEAASTGEMIRFETDMLSSTENLTALLDLYQ